MQDNRNPSDGQVSDGASMTVPAEVVDWVRRGAFSHIGSAAQALDTAALASDRAERPDWFRTHIEGMRETCALLDAIGWAAPILPTDAQVNLHRDGWALMRVLHQTLQSAEADAYQAMTSPDNDEPHQSTSHLLACERAARCAGLLCQLIAVAGAHIDALAVEEAADITAEASDEHDGIDGDITTVVEA